MQPILRLCSFARRQVGSKQKLGVRLPLVFARVECHRNASKRGFFPLSNIGLFGPIGLSPANYVVTKSEANHASLIFHRAELQLCIVLACKF